MPHQNNRGQRRVATSPCKQQRTGRSYFSLHGLMHEREALEQKISEALHSLRVWGLKRHGDCLDANGSGKSSDGTS